MNSRRNMIVSAIIFLMVITAGCTHRTAIRPSGKGLEIVLKVIGNGSDELRRQYAEVLSELLKERLEALHVIRHSVETGDNATVIVRTASLTNKRLVVQMITNPVLLEIQPVDKNPRDDNVFKAGNYVKSVTMTEDPFKEKNLMVQLNAGGARLFTDYTGKNRGKEVAVTIDGRVYFKAVIREKIMGGKLIVKGFSSPEETVALERILASGPYSEDVVVLSMTDY